MVVIGLPRAFFFSCGDRPANPLPGAGLLQYICLSIRTGTLFRDRNGIAGNPRPAIELPDDQILAIEAVRPAIRLPGGGLGQVCCPLPPTSHALLQGHRVAVSKFLQRRPRQMPQRWKVYEPIQPHFVTTTVVHLIPVFRREEYFRLLADIPAVRGSQTPHLQ